ncbi:hypothetical protein Tco_1265896 [Tanacetum coccineum]
MLFIMLSWKRDKDRPPMLAQGNYVQWKSKIKRYIDTKPNSELIHYCLQNPPYTYQWAEKTVLVAEGSSETTQRGIDNDIYSTVYACPNACEMWKAIERLKQESRAEDCLISLYDILKQHQNEVNEIRDERLARTANPLALVAQQQPVYHHHNHPTQNTQYSSTRSHQSTRNRGKAIVTSSAPTYDPEPATVTEDDEMSKEKEIDKLMALISLSFKKIHWNRGFPHIRDTLLNTGQMQTQESEIDTGKTLDVDLVDTESIRTDSTVQDDNSRSGNDTDADDADIKPIYDEEPMAEVQLTAECNIFAIGQQHTEQPEIINEGRVDQYPETCQVKSPMLESSPDNQTTEYSKQSLESENILLKKTVAQFQKDFSRMEAHCIALELKYQNQSLKSGQHGQILKQTSNKAKIEKEIDVLETMNIELEHSVATLPQIQEKVFAIAALKNDLRKLKGNSVDTKFDKTSVLGKPVLPSLRNQSVVRQPNAFKSERAQMSKQRFASQVDVNKNLSKPVTQHYLPKKTESAFAKPDHVIASSSSRNSSKNMPRFSSNDMVHNHYLDEARKKTQERDRNSKTSVMPSARFQSTADGSKPKPRRNNQTSRSLPVSKSSRVTITAVPKADHSKSSSSFSDSKNFVCSTCHKCVFNANHDACITKLLKEVNSRAKVPSNKTTNRNKPVEQIRIAKKPERQIPTGHRFSIKKTSAVHEKTMTLRSCLRWKPTGKIFRTVGLRWVPTGKIFTPSTTKVDSEPPNGSNADITNQYESAQTLDVSAGTSNLSAVSTEVHQAAETVTTSNELDLLFGPLFDEYFNGENQVVLKSSAVTTTDASNKRQQQPDSTSSTSTLATTVTANGNFDL